MAELKYDKNWAPQLLAAGITPASNPIDINGVIQQMIANLGGVGSQGPQGFQGAQGAQGSQGSGSQGAQGNQGAQGPQGFQGLSISGPQGTQGAQGNQGSSGNQGAQGSQGSQGSQGNQGSAGGVSSISAGDSSLTISPTTGAAIASRAALTGDATASAGSNATTVVALNGTSLAGLATGLLKNTTGTGVPSIGAAGTDYVASVTAADTSIVVAGASGARTVATASHDVIATNHPTAADWSNNSFGITALTKITFPTIGSTNTPITIGSTGQTLSAAPLASVILWPGTTTMGAFTAVLPPLIQCNGTWPITQTTSGLLMAAAINLSPTIKSLSSASNGINIGPFNGIVVSPTFNADTATGLNIGSNTLHSAVLTTSTTSSGTITSGVVIGYSTGGTIASTHTITSITDFEAAAFTINGTLTTRTAFLIQNPVNPGNVTTNIGIDIAALTQASGVQGIGIRNLAALQQGGAFVATNNVVTVTSNAGTVITKNYMSTFTNSSAATMAITMQLANAVDGQISVVRVYDASGVSQTIGWTNTENSTATVPTTSNGSTTLPKIVTFMYNSASSKWRCIQSV